MSKQAAVSKLLKLAGEVLIARKKPKKMPEGYFPEQARNSFLTREDADRILQAMSAGSAHDALKHTNVHLHGNIFKDFDQRVKDNPKLWNIGKINVENDPLIQAHKELPNSTMPDSYHTWSGDVYLPSGNPGVLMHELGHAVDMQEFPNETSYLRGLIGNTYRKTAPTLWKEHAAWRKGKDRLLTGAAKTDTDPKLVLRTMQDAAQVKPVGLGSYWGGALGLLGGGALGVGGTFLLADYLRRNHNAQMSPRLMAMMAFLGPTLGAAGGIGLGLRVGKAIGGREGTYNDKAQDKYLTQYAKVYAKIKGISVDEAKTLLQKSLAEAPVKKRKAA
jgi:hypothetical protein